jgi:hypothetical protein
MKNYPLSLTAMFDTSDEVPVLCEVTASVDIERDHYGTGDSPSSFEIKGLHIEGIIRGESIPLNNHNVARAEALIGDYLSENSLL